MRWASRRPTIREIAWVAGLFEGEGSIYPFLSARRQAQAHRFLGVSHFYRSERPFYALTGDGRYGDGRK